MAKLHEEGKILNWGISEPCMETLKKANAVFPVAAIESEYSFLSDASDAMFLKAAENTRFDGENLEKNMVLKNKLENFFPVLKLQVNVMIRTARMDRVSGSKGGQISGDYRICEGIS